MRSGIHGTFATLLLLIPVLSIPALAIFGIPHFAPVVASPLDEGPSPDRERRVGQSERHASEGFQGDFEDGPPSFDPHPGSRVDTRPPGKLGDSVPVPGMGRSAPPVNYEPEGKPSFDEPTRSESWAEDFTNDNRRPPAPNRSAIPNPPVDRSGFDPRYSDPRSSDPRSSDPRSSDPRSVEPRYAETRPNETRSNPPFDSRRSAQEPAPRERTADIAPTERRLPRRYQGEPMPGATGGVRQASNVEDQLTWQSAIRRLNELEIRNFRLERGHADNLFIFICSYTPSDSPRISRRFEAEADEPLKAVEKVLDQVSEWRQHR